MIYIHIGLKTWHIMCNHYQNHCNNLASKLIMNSLQRNTCIVIIIIILLLLIIIIIINLLLLLLLNKAYRWALFTN